MSEGEFLISLISTGGALIFWGIWLYRTLAIDRTFESQPQRQVLLVTPMLCAIILFAVLETWASHDVVDDPRYLYMYWVMGAAWVGAASFLLFPWLGLHYIHDAVERRNLAAAIGVSGGLIGFTLAFAGGNIGDGPGWWVVLFSSGLATATLTAAWIALSAFADMAEEISVDRDMAAAVRLAGFLVAAGMVCGRGAAGDWVSAEATFHDFWQIAWVVAPLLVITFVFDRLGRPTPETPAPSVAAYGVFPTLLSVVIAGSWLLTAGAW
jgi:hypothetical protein